MGDAEDQAVGRIERNYLWDALFNLVGLDWTSQELILSAIGTIVVTQSSGVTTWPPLISVDMLLDGGAVSRYSCDAACLNMNVVSEGNVTGLIVLVRDRLTAILSNVQARGDLTPSDIDFVTTAPFPLYRMVNALSTLTPAANPVSAKIVNVRIPASRSPDGSSRWRQPRSMPIASPIASATKKRR